MDLFLLLKIIIALALGALIGIERERKRHEMEFAGVRTFMLISLLGIISAYLSQFYSLFLGLAFLGVVAIIAVSYLVTTRNNGDVGLTTEVAALVTFILGAMCLWDDGLQIAPILAIIVTTILATKKYLHRFVWRISERELINTLKFLIIAFVILPLLPNTTIGPLEVFNPYQIWLMVVFISAISYAGYILMKFIGPDRGLGLTGIIGGFVSSTAVTTSMAARVKESGFLLKAAVFATVVASAMMFLRVLLEVSVINPSLISLVAVPMLVMGILGIVLAVFIWRWVENRDMDADLKLENPFSLKPALIFGGLFLAVLFISKLANIYLGSRGVYLASIISGVADVDAITISMSLLAPNTIAPATAATAITLAAMSNTVFKFLIALFLGTRKFATNVGLIFLFIIIAGLLAIFLV
jgi:uncharacterized membrane protein (DUF4010 family)